MLKDPQKLTVPHCSTYLIKVSQLEILQLDLALQAASGNFLPSSSRMLQPAPSPLEPDLTSS